MKQYAGIDVSLEYSSVCVCDRCGCRIVREAKVLSEPNALIVWFGEHGVAMERIGLEAGRTPPHEIPDTPPHMRHCKKDFCNKRRTATAEPGR